MGKPFGRLPADARSALQEARLDAIDTIASRARQDGISTVLVAGDVFDSPEPGDRIFRQALSRMKAAADTKWILLPGNHDPARSDGLWSRLTREAPANVMAVLEPKIVMLDDATALLPAPLNYKRTVDDPSAWFNTAETQPGVLRIGLAHGPVRTFGGGSDDATNLIAVDRARQAGLAYLALGDWHNRNQIDAWTAYSGTPEPDDFGREFTGEILAVQLGGPGEPPDVRPIGIAKYDWALRNWGVSRASEVEPLIAELAAAFDLKRLVARVTIAGVVSLAERVAIRERLEDGLAHEVRWLDVRSDDLVVRPTDNDLADIDAQGVLRDAAERLQAMSADGTEQGRRAAAALERLYVEHQRSQRQVAG